MNSSSKIKELQQMLFDHKQTFLSLKDFFEFASKFLEFLHDNKQAVIVSQNEHNYNFFQFNENAKFVVTRPFNHDLILDFNDFEKKRIEFDKDMQLLKKKKKSAKFEIDNPLLIDKVLYTIQQSIGFTLDTLPRKSNNGKKINGDLFELLMLKVMNNIGIDATHGTFPMEIKDNNGKVITKMNWQHDMIVHHQGETKPSMIGSVKTTSKDRISKVFMDKFLYNHLAETDTAQIAIFLHDVQREKTHKENVYKISQTFLTGHFKAYTLKLNPLDGGYYIDMRPIFKTDPLLKEQIKQFHLLLTDDIWQYVN